MLSDTALSIDWLKSVLQKDSQPLICWKAEKIGQNLGFSAHIIEVQLEWDTVPKSIVLKTPIAEKKPDHLTAEVEEQINNLLPIIHGNECRAYGWLHTFSASLKVPKINHQQTVTETQIGAIVMENFHQTGFVPNFADGLSLPQVREVVENLARVHGASVRDRSWLRALTPLPAGRGNEMPQIFREVSEILKEKCATRFVKLEQVARCFDSREMNEKREKSHENLEIQPILAHGDLWANNLIFERANANRLLSIIDWQTAHAGSSGEDLSRLLVSALDGKTRERETKKLMKLYYKVFSEEIKPLKPPFNYAKLKDSYELFLPSAMVHLLIGAAYTIKGKSLEGANEKERIETLLDRASCILEEVTVLIEDWSD